MKILGFMFLVKYSTIFIIPFFIFQIFIKITSNRRFEKYRKEIDNIR